MTNITITLTDTELTALKTVVQDPQEWIENFTKLRANKRLDEICKDSAIKYLDQGIAIPATKAEILADVISRGWYQILEDIEPTGSGDE